MRRPDARLPRARERRAPTVRPRPVGVKRAGALGGRRLYVDTSTSEKYAPTRAFYRGAGYSVAAEMPDFFRDGDGKVIFMKKLPPAPAPLPSAPADAAAPG